MLKQLSFSLLIGIATTTAYAQTDAEQITRASNALQVNQSCDNALSYLAKVSTAGKSTPDYLYTFANANDCKGNREQAIFYYSKYLELNPANDSVKKRVAELKDAKALAQKVANEERIARDQYKTASHRNKKKRSNFDDSYNHFGLAYIQPVGGSNAPYNSGICISTGYGFPIINDRAIIEMTFNNDILYNANLSWYRKAFNLSAGESVRVRGGYMGDVNMGFLWVLKNTHSYTWSAGVTLGGKLVSLPPVQVSYSDYYFSNATSFQFTWGVRSTFFWGRNAMFFLDYAHCPLSRITTDESYTTGYTSAISLNVLRVGVSFKMPSWVQW